MRVDRLFWGEADAWDMLSAEGQQKDQDHQLVLYFGSRAALSHPQPFEALRTLYPQAHIAGCSTGGQISENKVFDDKIAAVAIRFDRTRVVTCSTDIRQAAQSYACGEHLARQLLESGAPDMPSTVLILSDGLAVNGTKLADGLSSILPDIPINGGLAGDGSAFAETLVGLDAQPSPGQIVAIGLFGDHLRVKTGYNGGWDEFTSPYLMTSTDENELLEMDDTPLLDIYRQYMTDEEYAALPGSALLYPLRIFDPQHPQRAMMRTPLTVSHERKSLTLAGDAPKDWMAQLMRGDLDNLAQGAYDAAHMARPDLSACEGQSLALLVSCIGRRMVMGDCVASEAEAVGDAFGDSVVRIGFYSYGELTPNAYSGACELHNQTMTITTLYESA